MSSLQFRHTLKTRLCVPSCVCPGAVCPRGTPTASGWGRAAAPPSRRASGESQPLIINTHVLFIIGGERRNVTQALLQQKVGRIGTQVRWGEKKTGRRLRSFSVIERKWMNSPQLGMGSSTPGCRTSSEFHHALSTAVFKMGLGDPRRVIEGVFKAGHMAMTSVKVVEEIWFVHVECDSQRFGPVAVQGSFPKGPHPPRGDVY